MLKYVLIQLLDQCVPVVACMDTQRHILVPQFLSNVCPTTLHVVSGVIDLVAL